MASTRRRRFGNVELLKSGKYRALYRGPDGKRHRAPHTFYDEGDASAWLRDEQRLLEFDEWTPPAARAQSREDRARTVGDWMKEWMALRETGVDALEPSTAANYWKDINLRILNVTGKAARLRDIPLTQLTRRDIAAWWDDISARFSPTVCYNTYKRLRAALNAAVDRDMIPANPATLKAATRRPKTIKKELPDYEVLKAIVDELDHTKTRVDGAEKAIAILTFFHGLRIGEALGLRRKDITRDPDGHYFVHIRGNVYRTKDGMVWKPRPKSEAGYRTVPIFSAFEDDITWHLEHRAADSPDAMLFTTGTGATILDTSYRSILNRAKKRAGYEDLRITPHYGRNWVITTLAEAGMPIPAIGEFLGQRDLRTITEVYMRVTDKRKDAVLGTVDRIFHGQDAEVADINAERIARRSNQEYGNAENLLPSKTTDRN